jgi:hypothetical protein
MFTPEVVVAFITGVIGPVSLILIKNKIDKQNKKKPDMVMDALKLSKVILDKVDYIKESFDADRVWLAQFHNGGHFYPTGKSMAKFSILYESVSVNTLSIQSNFQNIPVNLFTRSLNELLKNDYIKIPDYKDETIATFGLKYLADDTGCKSGYLFAIKTIEDKFVGILGLDYTKDHRNLDDEEITELEILTSSIGGVLVKE